MSGNAMATMAAILGATLAGMVLALLGLFKQDLLDKSQPGADRRLPLLFTCSNLFLIPAMLLAGAAVDRWGIRETMLTGLGGLGLAFLLFSAALTGRQAFATFLLAALGGAAVSISAIVLASRVFFPGETVASVAMACVFTALGAALVPPLRDLLVGGLGHRRTFLVLALYCLLPVFPLLVTPSGVLGVPNLPTVIPSLVEQERVWLAAAVFAFYAPLEAAMSWVGRGAGRGEGGAEEVDQAPLIAFWVSVVVSRLAVVVLQHFWVLLPRWDGWLLAGLAFLTAVMLGNLVGTADRQRTRWGALLLGVILGPIYPALCGMVLRECPHEQGTALAVLFAAGSVGSLLVAPAFRRRTEDVKGKMRKEAYFVQVLPLVLAVLLTAAALLFVLANRT